MSAEAIKDFGNAAFDAIRAYQNEIKDLRAELEERDRIIDLLAAALDRLDPERTQR